MWKSQMEEVRVKQNKKRERKSTQRTFLIEWFLVISHQTLLIHFILLLLLLFSPSHLSRSRGALSTVIPFVSFHLPLVPYFPDTILSSCLLLYNNLSLFFMPIILVIPICLSVYMTIIECDYKYCSHHLWCFDGHQDPPGEIEFR